MKKVIAILFFLVSLTMAAKPTCARENVDYWYVKEFKTEILINKDSSIDVTENITADCGIAQKHGIYRTLPTFQQLTEKEKNQSPVTLISITDFSNSPLKYSTSKSVSDGTITWKIGDANKTVTGVNNYQIKYHVKNAVRHGNFDFDEFYWNLSGNFWDMEIDNFSATVVFPEEITRDNSTSNIYSGKFGDKNLLGVTYNWIDKNKLQVGYFGTMKTGEGITLSTTFPKNIIIPYVPTFWEKYGSYFFLLIPIFIILLMYLLWKKLGRDPKINPTIAPEFEIPEDLSPIDMGLALTDSILKNYFVSASIINLAVKERICIEKIGKKDFKITKKSEAAKISDSEEKLLVGLFASGSPVQISDLKMKFYTNLPIISEAGVRYLISKNWLIKNSRLWQYLILALGIILFVLSFGSFALNFIFGLSILLSSVIVVAFSVLMPRRSKEGAELLRRIKGFKLYMHTAERYRQKFNEKENIFEKFLPYAIMFGITKEWTNKMKVIYGEEYFNSYHPVWFIGPNFTSFNVDSLASEISSMSSNMSSTISSSPSSSGSGGGGW